MASKKSYTYPIIKEGFIEKLHDCPITILRTQDLHAELPIIFVVLNYIDGIPTKFVIDRKGYCEIVKIQLYTINIHI